MCGIAGIFNIYNNAEISRDVLAGMVAMLRHRGPDGIGFLPGRPRSGWAMRG